MEGVLKDGGVLEEFWLFERRGLMEFECRAPFG